MRNGNDTFRDGLEAAIGDHLEMVEGPYFGWTGHIVDYGEEPGWILVLFDNGNEIEVPACKAAKLTS